MKELYKIKVSGPVGCGKTTRANAIFEERAAEGLSTRMVDDGEIRAVYRGADPDYVTVVTALEGYELTVIKVQ